MLIMSLLLSNAPTTQAESLLSSGTPLVSVELSIEAAGVMKQNVKLFTDRDYKPTEAPDFLLGKRHIKGASPI